SIRILFEQIIAAIKGYRGGRAATYLGTRGRDAAILKTKSLIVVLVRNLRVKEGKVSSIPTVLSRIDSISSDGFLPFIPLVVVIMVTVIIVAVVLEIVVVVIVGIDVLLHAPSTFGLWLGDAFHQDKASLVRVPVANVTLSSSAHLLCENTDSFPLFGTEVSLDSRFLLGLSVFAMVAASASRAAAIPSEINCRIVTRVMAGAVDVDTLLGGILST
nr:hypothetical protein [Tanacetum cinerariifolium]